jgi:hypothetical protein
VICADAQELRSVTDTLALPLIVKEARSESHAGRHYVRDRASLNQVALDVTYPVLAQQVVTGHEFAVELLSGGSGTLVWPVASLGTLDSNCAPGKQARVEPAALPGRVQEALVSVVQDITDAYRPAGPWQIDFAVSGDEDGEDGGLHLIELNGRFGGLSNMSWLTTGSDPHLAHIDAVLGRPLKQPQPTRVALEIPVHNGVELPPAPTGLEVRPFVGSPVNQVPLTSGYYRTVIGVPKGREEDARQWLRRLPPDVLLVDPGEAIAQLDIGVQVLSEGGASAFTDALLSREA